MKTSLWRIVLAAVVTFAAGLALKYFELSTYIIIIGFRFHIGAVLPFLFIAGLPLLPYIKKEFLNPPFKRTFLFLLIILIPLLAGNGVLYILKLIHLGDPEYFYEFGLSSVFDYPIYLIWNAPQLIMLYFFLLSVFESFRIKFTSVLLITILLFGYEFIPFNRAIIGYNNIASFAGIAITTAVIIKYYKNVYWFCITLFTLLWSAVLMAGSISKGLINNLFASQYRNWEGMLEMNNIVGLYYIAGYFAIATLIALAGIGLSVRKKESLIEKEHSVAERTN